MFAHEDSNDFFIGEQMAGQVVYPDFFATDASTFWEYELSGYGEICQFSGMMLG
jgi:hypothetical protein